MANNPSQPPPDTSGIHIGDVGGSVNFSALGDIVGGDKITNITTTIQISVEAITQRPLITASPYRGLDRFEDKDKDLFFGRDQLIKSLLTQLSASNVLLVLGASGSGKSSVVRAGLLPQLAQLIGAKFRYFTFVPDVNPFESLRATLLAAGFSQAQTRELADARPETPANLIHTLQRSGDQWLFFVDQFEEIFTVGDEKLRASFVEALVQIAQDPNSSTKLVLAMRADFLDRFSPFPQFAKIIEKNIDFVADMHPDELRLAIEQPAARHGVVFEQGLVEEIIKDVQGQAGSLPLLQYTLDLLWQEEAREDALADRHLNAWAYRELGGVRGALQKRADEIYDSFGDGSDAKAATPKQETVRQIFLRLVDLAGEGSNDAAWRPVRRRASMTIFATAQEQEILQALINQKLLVSNREGDDATVEVAHEALFTSWGRLKNWIEAGKQVIFARNRLADDARRWQRRQQDGDADADEELLAGSRLSQALDMRARGDFNTVVGGLGETEAQFLDASAVLRDRRRQEEQERQQHELAQAQALAAEQKKRGDDQAKAAARLRWFTWAMVGVSLLALVAAVFAWTKQREAAQQARIALSRELAAAATHSNDAHLTVILAREAVAATYSADKSVTAEAAEVLRNSVPPEPTILSVGHRNPISALAFSPDGKRLVTASEEAVKIWNAASGDELRDVSGLTKDSLGKYGKLIGVAFSGDGERVVWCSTLDAKIWDSFSGRELFAEPPMSGGPITGFAFSQDGRRLAIARNNELRSWDPLSPGQMWVVSFDPVTEQSNPVFSPDGKILAVTRVAAVQLLDASTGNERVSLTNHTRSVGGVAFSPNGKRLATISGENNETVKVWDIADLPSPRELPSLPNKSETVTHIVFSPDSSRLAWTSEKRTHIQSSHTRAWQHEYAGHTTVKVWDITSNTEASSLPDQTKVITCLAFSPDGAWLATASDADVQLYDAVKGGKSQVLAGRNVVAFNRDGHVASPGANEQATIWDPSSPNELVTIPGQTEVRLISVAFSSDRARLATTSGDQRIRVWDLASGRNTLTTSSSHSGSVDAIAFSADGKCLLTGGMDHIAKLLDSTSGSEIRALEGRDAHRDRILSVACSPTEPRLLTGSYDQTAKLWDQAGNLLQTFVHGNAVFSVAFSPDGKRVVTTSASDGKIWSIGPEKKAVPLSGSASTGGGIAFSRDGKLVASRRQVWDATTGQALFPLAPSGNDLRGPARIAISSDSNYLATGGDGTTALLWGNEPGKEPVTLDNGVEVTSLAFTPGEQYVAIVGKNWTVRLHPVKIEGLMNLARQRVSRELSADERRKYLHTK